MSNLYENVCVIINSNTLVYERNKLEIQQFMVKRWPTAFEIVSESNGEELDYKFPTAVTSVAQKASDAVEHEKFLQDFQEVLDHLTAGGGLHYGEFC